MLTKVGFGEALFSTLRNPLVASTGAGALIGAGTGYFSSNSKSQDIRRRQALSGAAVGAGIGALTGALSQHSTSRIREIFEQGKVLGHGEGIVDGAAMGREHLMNKLTTEPESAVAVIGNMQPELREQALKIISGMSPPRPPTPEAIAQALESMDATTRKRVIAPHVNMSVWWSSLTGQKK